MTTKHDGPDPLLIIGFHLPHLRHAASGVSGLGLLLDELVIQKCSEEPGVKTIMDKMDLMEGLAMAVYCLGSRISDIIEILEVVVERNNPDAMEGGV